MKKIAAFFDIDGTLYRDSLMIEHFKKLIRYEVIDQSIWHNHVKPKYLEWERRKGEYDEYMEELAKLYIEALTNKNKNHLQFIADQVIRLQWEKVYTFTRDRITWHRDEGHLVIFISGAPDFLVSPMAKKYHADAYRGSTYMLEGEIFTGEVHRMWDATSKIKAIDNFGDVFGIDFAASYAYGDTNGDVSMLKRVGHPVAVNPTKELLATIKNDPDLRKKTQIIVERKDVVYHIDANVDYL